MTKNLTLTWSATALTAALVLAGCASSDNDDPADPAPSTEHDDHGGHDDMEHPTDGGPVPENMTEATDPEYPVGSEVTLTADHMHGMDGATATIVGAYDTFTYSVDYTPEGGEPVTDHQWVVQEEIEDAGDERLADGADVVLLADHMEGMAGVTATIASSTDETVYVVDYEADGMTMTNHKWVVESEIEPTS
ncbi:YdhK family protein [Nesterenkonia lacusekhoensis]|uniref:DUF1541 domain-containing protein n=1 Tax=Nesterenkonia lacusekhoensis TaxID=150832 RepID=A0ABS4SZV8_9MICC|nr:YdhK family protein [Nesterenkonia lacusekhoensis]MBP2317698.1 hypothetical protein [Nesterenkonia lacusekhoensis]